MKGDVDWKTLVRRKQEDRNSRIPEKWRLPPQILELITPVSEISAFDILKDHKLLSDEELHITEDHTAQELLQKLARGELTAVEVCSAFCKRAAIAQQLTNCATEIFFDVAMERARFLDDYFMKEKKTVGPFHGLPISVKDSFNIRSQASTLGYVSYLTRPVAEENSPLISMILNNGGILYIKTNVPQTLMTIDTENHVFGRTLNPHKLSLTAGGSSGGEGALVAFRGSILGVGTDIGGSIRAPSLCCGIYGFKPTTNRIPYGKQQASGRPGSPGIVASAGPHAHSASDMSFFFKQMVLAEPWKYDSTAVGIPWREVPRKNNLTVGVYLGDGDYPLIPPIMRALKSAVQKLEAAGHNIVTIEDFPSLEEGVLICCTYFALDNKKTRNQIIRDGEEEPIASLAVTIPKTAIEPREYNIDDVWDANQARNQYQEKIFRIWQENKLDVLLCPGAATTATPHDTYGMPAYTMIWNLLDFPASVLPYANADKRLDSGVSPDYDPEPFEGAPCSVQVVGWRYQDEEVLMATEIIDQALRV